MRNFRYKPSLDVATTLIGSFIALIIFVVMRFIIASDPLKVFSILFAAAAIIFIIFRCLDIYGNTFRRLSIGTNEIIYNTGWLTKKTISIPAHKIRSCSKSSGVLQRACGTMDISVTTSGDSAEICFINIEHGEEAYSLLSRLAQNNGSER